MVDASRGRDKVSPEVEGAGVGSQDGGGFLGGSSACSEQGGARSFASLALGAVSRFGDTVSPNWATKCIRSFREKTFKNRGTKSLPVGGVTLAANDTAGWDAVYLALASKKLRFSFVLMDVISFCFFHSSQDLEKAMWAPPQLQQSGVVALQEVRV